MGLRGPNSRLSVTSAQYFGGSCGAMICGVLGSFVTYLKLLLHWVRNAAEAVKSTMRRVSTASCSLEAPALTHGIVLSTLVAVLGR